MERDLKDYIVKLNDRNIQRQREVGFTLYAIIGAIVYCALYLIDNIDIPLTIFNDYRYLTVAVFVTNAVFIFLTLFLVYIASVRRLTQTKVFLYQQPLKIDVNFIPYLVYYLTICTLNYLLLRHCQTKSLEYLLWVFILIGTANSLSPFIFAAIRQYSLRRKKKKRQSVEEISFTFFNKKATRGFVVGGITLAAILSALWVASIQSINYSLEIGKISAISKYVLIYLALLLLLNKTFDIKSRERSNNQLEDFEKEIFFYQYSNDEIAIKYETEFDGIPFSKWIKEKLREMMDFFSQKRQVFLSQELLLSNVDKVDKKQLPHEFNGRLQVCIDNQNALLIDMTDFVEKTARSFKNLRNFSSLNEIELGKLDYVQSQLNGFISEFNIKHTELLKQIQAKQDK